MCVEKKFPQGQSFQQQIRYIKFGCRLFAPIELSRSCCVSVQSMLTTHQSPVIFTCGLTSNEGRNFLQTNQTTTRPKDLTEDLGFHMLISDYIGNVLSLPHWRLLDEIQNNVVHYCFSISFRIRNIRLKFPVSKFKNLKFDLKRPQMRARDTKLAVFDEKKTLQQKLLYLR